MSELTTARIRGHASRLGLTHLADNLEQQLARANHDQMGYLDFLDLLLEEETAARDGRRFRTALRISRLPHHKELDAFDFSFQPDLDPRKIKDLAPSHSSKPRPTQPFSAHPE